MGRIMRMAEDEQTGPKPPAASGTRVVDLDALLQGARRVTIRHDGRRYALRLTKLNKLILTRDDADKDASADEEGASS